jgi:hypothetical protein
MPDAYVQIPKPVVNEANSFTATARFRASGTATAPTTAHYRVDCQKTGTVIQDWTALAAAAEISIPITSNNNRIIDRSNANEKRLITVAADKDTTTETRDSIEYIVNNRGWS